jgi:DNA primase catalytic core
MKLNEQLKEQINTNILQVIGANVALKKSGSSYKGLCPFHGEKTPSFYVNEGRNRFHCFGCGASGDPIEYIKKRDGGTFEEACVELGRINNIKIELNSIVEFNHDEEDIFLLLDSFKQHTLKTVLSDYLRKRGLSDQTITFFEIGYYGRDLRIDKELGQKAGLFSNNFNLMTERLTIPIKNKWGKTIAFGGRTLVENYKEKDIHKYINTMSSIVYDKSGTLYNYWNAINFAKESKNMIVVEGYADVWGLWDKGIYNVVAACGTSFTEQHALLIAKVVGKGGTVAFAYDNDSAGYKALVKSMHICLKNGLTARFVRLPKDPDEYVLEIGRDKFNELINNAVYFVDILCIKYEEDEGKRAMIVDKLRTTLKDCKDIAFKIAFIRSLCERLHLIPSMFDTNLTNFTFNSKISFVSLGEEEKLLKQFNSVQHLLFEGLSIVTHLVGNMQNMDCFSSEFNGIIAALKQNDFTVLDGYKHEPSELEAVEAYEHILGLYERQVALCLLQQNKIKIINCTDNKELDFLFAVEKKLINLIKKIK